LRGLLALRAGAVQKCEQLRDDARLVRPAAVAAGTQRVGLSRLREEVCVCV
jgi:hypothetical protein